MADMTEDDLLVLRLRIADTTEPPLLTTDHLRAIWDTAPGPWSAAADALEVIAVSEVLVSKKIRTQDLQTDGPAVAAELRALAREWDAKADALEGVGEGFIGYIPGPGAVTGRYEGEEGRAWWG